jgi:hypothetical protein
LGTRSRGGVGLSHSRDAAFSSDAGRPQPELGGLSSGVTSGRLRKRTRFYDPDDEELLRRVCLASVVDHEQHTDKPSLRGCLARREQSAPEAPDVIELTDDSSDSAPPVGVPMQLDESAFRLSERGATFIAPRTSAAAQRRLADLVAEFGQFAQRANFTLTSAPGSVRCDD